MFTVLFRDDIEPREMWSSMSYADGVVIEHRVMGRRVATRHLCFEECPDADAVTLAENARHRDAGFREAGPGDDALLASFYVAGPSATAPAPLPPAPDAEARDPDPDPAPGRAQGAADIEDDLTGLCIAYDIGRMDPDLALKKRAAMCERVESMLVRHGLGYWDGGAIRPGTLEAFFEVSDPDRAADLIAENLQGTSFDDYSRIFVLDR